MNFVPLEATIVKIQTGGRLVKSWLYDQSDTVDGIVPLDNMYWWGIRRLWIYTNFSYMEFTSKREPQRLSRRSRSSLLCTWELLMSDWTLNWTLLCGREVCKVFHTEWDWESLERETTRRMPRRSCSLSLSQSMLLPSRVCTPLLLRMTNKWWGVRVTSNTYIIAGNCNWGTRETKELKRNKANGEATQMVYDTRNRREKGWRLAHSGLHRIIYMQVF